MQTNQNHRSPRSMVHASLERVVANKYVIQMMLNHTKWRIKGPLFYPVQAFVEEQKGRISHHIEEIFERMHISNQFCGVNTSNINNLIEIDEYHHQHSSDNMLEHLSKGFKQMVGLCHTAQLLAKVSLDDVTADMLYKQRCHYHKQYISLLKLLSSK